MRSVRHPVVLIDLDHTLLDSDTSEAMAFEQALGAVGITDSPAYLPDYLRINGDLWAAVERGEMAPEEVREERFRRLVGLRSLDADPRLLSEEYTAGLMRHGDLFPGALEVLGELAALARLALVTNGISDIQRARIERLGIGSFFETVVVSSDVGVAKPHGGIFAEVFARLGGIYPDGALMVGDSLTSDMRGGADYGLATCWFNPGRLAAPEEPAITYTIELLAELPPIVAGD